MIRALVLGAIASQMIVPAFAADNLNLISSASGWRRQGDGAVMAYVRMPFGGTAKSEAQPRAGLKLVAGRSYERGEVTTHINNPTLIDIGFTGRSLRSPWAPTLNAGRTVMWTSNPNVLPPSQRQKFLGNGDLTWPIVGIATVAVGIFLATELD